MNKKEDQTRERITQALRNLTDEEKNLLENVLSVEQAKIHLGKPHVIEDLRKAVIGAIKA